MRIVVITASRYWDRPSEVAQVIAGADLVLVGDCPQGGDLHALDFANKANQQIQVFCADPKRATKLLTQWSREKRSNASVRVCADWIVDGDLAGPLRNHALAVAAREYADNASNSVECHAFLMPDSNGTPYCIRLLRMRGLTVMEHR
jgi:hypothetical protein